MNNFFTMCTNTSVIALSASQSINQSMLYYSADQNVTGYIAGNINTHIKTGE